MFLYALAAQARGVSQGNTDNLDLSLVCNDARAANLSILFERYYGENADPLDGLMTDGKLKGHFVNLQRQVGAFAYPPPPRACSRWPLPPPPRACRWPRSEPVVVSPSPRRLGSSAGTWRCAS